MTHHDFSIPMTHHDFSTATTHGHHHHPMPAASPAMTHDHHHSMPAASPAITHDDHHHHHHHNHHGHQTETLPPFTISYPYYLWSTAMQPPTELPTTAAGAPPVIETRTGDWTATTTHSHQYPNPGTAPVITHIHKHHDNRHGYLQVALPGYPVRHTYNPPPTTWEPPSVLPTTAEEPVVMRRKADFCEAFTIACLVVIGGFTTIAAMYA